MSLSPRAADPTTCRFVAPCTAARSRVETAGDTCPDSYRATAAWDVPDRRASSVCESRARVRASPRRSAAFVIPMTLCLIRHGDMPDQTCPSHPTAALEGPPEGDLVRIFQIPAHRKPAREAGDGHAKRADHAR